MKNYDPNIYYGKHIIKLTLQQWGYKGHIWIEMRGNCKGLNLITFLDNYFECEEGGFSARNDCDLKEEDGYWTGVLKDEAGNELEFEDTSNDMDKMVVAIEFESFEEE